MPFWYKLRLVQPFNDRVVEGRPMSLICSHTVRCLRSALPASTVTSASPWSHMLIPLYCPPALLMRSRKASHSSSTTPLSDVGWIVGMLSTGSHSRSRSSNVASRPPASPPVSSLADGKHAVEESAAEEAGVWYRGNESARRVRNLSHRLCAVWIVSLRNLSFFEGRAGASPSLSSSADSSFQSPSMAAGARAAGGAVDVRPAVALASSAGVVSASESDGSCGSAKCLLGLCSSLRKTLLSLVMSP